MRVFLTGATGYIGSAVADALRAAGHEVVGLVRSEGAVGKLEARGIHARRGDLREPQSIAQSAREADAVIHTASTNDGSAQVAWPMRRRAHPGSTGVERKSDGASRLEA